MRVFDTKLMSLSFLLGNTYFLFSSKIPRVLYLQWWQWISFLYTTWILLIWGYFEPRLSILENPATFLTRSFHLKFLRSKVESPKEIVSATACKAFIYVCAWSGNDTYIFSDFQIWTSTVLKPFKMEWCTLKTLTSIEY